MNTYYCTCARDVSGRILVDPTCKAHPPKKMTWKEAAKAYRQIAKEASEDYVALSEELILEQNENYRFRQALLVIADPHNEKYQGHAAGRIAREALGQDP